VRQLYTDDEEVLFQAARPILLNGIEDVIGRPDPADPPSFLRYRQLARRADARRRSFGANSKLHGRVSWALCSMLWRTACDRLAGQGPRPQALPRMADFAHWISACETGLWSAGTFARACAENRRAAIEGVIDGEPGPRNDGAAKRLDRNSC
jgi:hypothetical protein